MAYCFASEATRLIGQRALEDLVDPGRGGRRVAVVVLRVQRSVGKATILLVLLPLLLQQVGDGVQQVVEELVGILLHVVIKQLCGGGGEGGDRHRQTRARCGEEARMIFETSSLF